MGWRRLEIVFDKLVAGGARDEPVSLAWVAILGTAVSRRYLPGMPLKMSVLAVDAD